jgi:CheY-like chemotaxis protein
MRCMTFVSPLASRWKTVLIVDDDPFLTEYVELLLTKWSYRARVAHGGMEGLGLAQKHRPDCILLDLAMPEVDGFAFLLHRKKIVELVDIPVIVLSANHRGADVQRALMLGAKGYITKPVDEEALFRRLERVVPNPLYSPPEKTDVVWSKVQPKSLL